MTTFATHGDVLKFLYAAFGILPRKEAHCADFDETDKKTLQTRLARLAKEEGGLHDNYQSAADRFRDLLRVYLPTPGHVEEVSMTLYDLDAVYAAMIREEGTYLPRRESLQYFISMKAIPNFVLALNRSLLVTGAYAPDGVWSADPFWYLPTREAGNKWTMPLAKVMRWAYAACDTSQNAFHWPRTRTPKSAPVLEQNMDNAVRWTSGKQLPSLPALIANFEESFAAQAAHGKPVEPALQRRILTALVFARVANFLATEVRAHCSDDYLDDVCDQLRQATQRLQPEVSEFLKEVGPVMDRKAGPALHLAWLEACMHHEHFLRQKLTLAATTLNELLVASPGQPFPAEALGALRRQLGEFAVATNLDCLKRHEAITIPEGFARLLFEGIDLRRNPDTTLPQVDEFEAGARAQGVHDALCWLFPWLRGVVHYRKDDFTTAFAHYSTAFELAKYRAGRNQYKLVNQFVELACKNDDARAIRKGVEWAAYIGVQLRWLRDKEASPENIEFMRHMMKTANYAHQL